MLKNEDIFAINRYINQNYSNNKIKRLIKKNLVLLIYHMMIIIKN